MASYAYTFTSGDTVTPTKLNNARTVSEIVNADVSATAAIAGTKVAPAFGAQDITVSGAFRSITNTGNFGLAFGTNNTQRAFFGPAGGFTVTSGGIASQGQTATYNAFQLINTSGVEVQLAANGNSSGDIRTATNHPLNFLTNNTERMRIDASGNVGIGTTSPTLGRLQVEGGRAIFAASSEQYVVGAKFSAAGGAVYFGAASASATPNAVISNAGGVTLMTLTDGGGVGIGTSAPAYTLHVNGSVAGTSAYNNLSDAREKENVVYGIANALNTVKALKPARFDFKEGDKGKIGFIAQDVQPLVPEVITSYEKTLPDDTKEERLSIQESSLTAVLVAAVQELSTKVEALEAA